MVLNKQIGSLIIITLFTLIHQPGLAQNFEGLSRSDVRKIKKNLEAHFPAQELSSVLIDSENIPNSVKELIKPKDKFFYIQENLEIKSYLYLTSTRGRIDDFDYMVLYDPGFFIKDIQILVYRSEHGYQIMNKKWLQQYFGSTGCDMEYGKDIQALSGATISANALTIDLARLCVVMAAFKKSHAMKPIL